VSAVGPVFDAVSGYLVRRSRWSPAEVAFWVFAFSTIWLFPGKYLIMKDAAILALFALSLDLILGYAGIISLGQAAFFGLAGYFSGLVAKYGFINEPVIALVCSGLVAAALGFVTSFLVLRGSDLTRLMVTLGVSLMLGEIANRYSGLTGGADGLQGVDIAPVLGLFRFDLYGHTGYIYCLIVLFICFLLARRVVYSPFGLSLRALKGNALRASAIGIPVKRRMVAIYTLSAGIAGIAGGLLTQTTAFCSLDVFSFDRSADLLLVLIIGGSGYLYGGLIGAVIYKFLQDWVASLTPQYWQFWIGFMLVVIVLVGRERVEEWTALVRATIVRFGARSSRVPPRSAALRPTDLKIMPILETIDLEKRFGGIVAAHDLSLSIEKGARHALIGPNGAGKTTVINLLTGVLKPTDGRIILDGKDITALAPHQRVRLGMARTFQINQLFPDLTPLESIGQAISERMGTGAQWWRVIGSKAAVTDEIVEILERFRLVDVMHERTAILPYGKQRLLEIALAFACRPQVLLLDEPAAGVPDVERHELLATIEALPAEVTVLLIEHDMDLVFSFADRITVLVNGGLLVDGPPEEVARDPRVKSVYLGEELDA